MTPAEHRAIAEDCLATAETYQSHVHARADLLQRATVHALLALGPEPRPASEEELQIVITEALSTVSDLGEDAPPTPAPRKRTARKTTTSKETSK